MIALCYHHLLSEVYVLQTFMMKNISPEPSATIGECSQSVSEGLYFLLLRFPNFHTVLDSPGATVGLESPDPPRWTIEVRVEGIDSSMQQLLMSILHSRKDPRSN